MPVFELQTQDGRKFQVDAPDAEKAAASLTDHAGSPAKLLDKAIDTAGAFLGGAIGGIPIVGPAIKGGVVRAAAGARSMMDDTPYEDELKRAQGAVGQIEKEHPVAETAGEIAGGIGAMGAAGATATGARMLGMAGDSLPGMMARGAASGAAINAADAGVRGENPLTAGVVGAGVGGVAPAVGRAVSTAVAPVARTLRGIYDPAAEAARRVAGSIERDIGAGSSGLSGPEFVGARAEGQPVALMDMGGETTRALARSAANTSPEGRSTLNATINPRFEAQGERLTDWLRSTFNYPNATAQQEALDQLGKTVNRGAYARAYHDGSKGLWSPELERLAGSDAVASAMQSAVKSAKDEAIVSGYGAMNPRITFSPDGRIQFTKGPKGVPTYPDLQFWDLTRRELSDAAMRAGPGTAESRRLGTFAKTLNAELDKMVPSYKDARAGAAKFFGANDALEAGQQAVTSRMNNQEIRAGLGKMSTQEKQLFQDGFVDRYVQMIREAPDRRSVLNQIGTSSAARERLMLALGPQRANELEGMLRVEGIMDLARTAVQGNSTTARQLTELGLAGGVNLYEGGGMPTADPAALMNAALVYGAARGHRASAVRVAQHVARLLTSSDPTQLRNGMRLLARNRTLMNSVRQADAALASIAARGAEPGVSRHLGAQ